MVQEHKNRSTKKSNEDEVASAPQGAETTEGLSDDVDDILDEIDAVLETNAEEFVKSYIQKGGQ